MPASCRRPAREVFAADYHGYWESWPAVHRHGKYCHFAHNPDADHPDPDHYDAHSGHVHGRDGHSAAAGNGPAPNGRNGGDANNDFDASNHPCNSSQ